MDLKHAARVFRKSPGFTGVAVATLALGIGGNTVVFTAIESFLLRPLPLKEPERLVFMKQVENRTGELIPVSRPDFADWMVSTSSFESLTAFHIDTFNVSDRGSARRIRGARVSSEFFHVLGVAPELGRSFLPGQDRENSDALVLSHSLWVREFGSRPDVIGRRINVDGAPRTVIGVMPPELKFPGDFSQLWLPLDSFGAKDDRGARHLVVVGRLRQGVSIGEARLELETIGKRLETSYPATNRGIGVRVTPLHEQLVYGAKRALMVLFVTAVFVLLISCANIANLLLARSFVRDREIAVRMAVGAGSAVLLRQMLAESVLLAIAGSGAGLLVAAWGIAALANVLPPVLQPMGGLTMDVRVLGFCAVLTVLTTLLFGLLPARRILKPDLVDALRSASPRTRGAGTNRTAGALVIAELAIAVLLVVSAGLLIGWLRKARSAELGFCPDRVLTAEIAITSGKYRDVPERSLFLNQLLARLDSTPGVVAASAVNWPPMTSDTACRFVIEGRKTPDHLPVAYYRVATPKYAGVMSIPVLRGRFVTEADASNAEPVVVVNDRLARVWWPGEEVLGKRLALADGSGRPGPWATVVGVLGNIRHSAPLAEPLPELFFPLAQRPQNSLYLAIRTSGNPAAFARTLESVTEGLDPDLPLNLVRTMTHVIDDQSAASRITAALMTIFSAMALLLAAMGLYGVMSYLVARRSHEFGIRLALGATSGNLLRLMLRRALALTAAGAALGLLLAWGAARALSAAFEGIHADPVVFGVVATLLSAVVLFASWVPLRRALAAGPLSALHHD